MIDFVPKNNVIDSKSNLSLDSFIRYTYDDTIDAVKINPECKIEYGTVENLQYIKIKNFLKHPEKLRTFLSKFPCEDKMLSLEKKCETKLDSKAPGFQQIFDSIYFSDISKYLHGVLNKYHIINYGWKEQYWEYYSNCVYSGMKSYNANYTPHTDEFKLAANIYLTDVENTGTSFFKYKSKNNTYDSCLELIKPKNLEDFEDFIDNQKNIIKNNSGVGDWIKFQGDEKFIKYHYIPAEYNSVTMYKGNYWHSIDFDATVPDTIRYSLVSVLTH